MTKLTAGGNIIDYPGDVSTPSSDLNTTKIHVNSAISDVKVRYMCMDVRKYLLEKYDEQGRIYHDTDTNNTT